ncbi:MAG: 4-alpha-glucanotransferase [Rectinemataceae bacterium]|nr:4-alpha-glucanotransferase [Rectinemataceae bacterium]
MEFERSAGILLHPTSLPGPFGVGTMGKDARNFVDFLAETGVGLWQILPLGPTGYGDSPYQCLSSFAGNIYLLDPEELRMLGLASDEDVDACRTPNTGSVNFGRLFAEKNRLVDAAWERYKDGVKARTAARAGFAALETEFTEFSAENVSWLDDYALFSAIKEDQGFASWDRWPKALRRREASAIGEFAKRAHDRIGRHAFAQYLFWRQWVALHSYARSRKVKIIGDLPIFVAYDSADTWAHPRLFLLDEEGKPTKVAGVPPDYFTATGQLWGNPLYDWKAHKAEGFAWWISRIKATLEVVDILRIDHFRGFVDYWAVPAGDATAARGRWEKGPGLALFEAIEAKLGDLPIIAEDLGFMTPEVGELRERLGFPGMKILQFAFEPEGDNDDYPHNYDGHCVVYTGTHDNDTSIGWLGSAAPSAARRALKYVGGRRASFAWNMIKTAWASPARIAIAPAQDLLGLGTEARMNYPGTQNRWWTWRMADGAFTPAIARLLKALTRVYFRSFP